MLQKIEKQGENIVVTLGRSSATLTGKGFIDHKMLIAEYEKAVSSDNDGVELENGRLSSFKVLATAPEEGVKEEGEDAPQAQETPKPPGRKKKEKAAETTAPPEE